jgi:hypothetical protein
MMIALAWVAEKLAGPWLKSLVLPGLFLGLLTAAHQFTKSRAEAALARDESLVLMGRTQCFAEVELAQAKADLRMERVRLDVALREAVESQEVAKVVGEQLNELEKRLRDAEAAAPGSNPACLSDGMRQRIWGPAGNASGGVSGGGGGVGKSGGRTP